MEHMGLLSLIPPIIAVILAIITKNVIISLFSGVFVGVLILVGGNPLTATTGVIGDYLFPQLADGYNAAILVLIFFIGGFVALMEKSGGGAALAAASIKYIKTRTSAQISAWIGGLIIFFSDLGSPLINGPVFEKIFDKLKLSREKLAWIIDATASPVAVLVPFIGWGVYIMGLIRAEFDKLGIADSEFSTLVQVIPFQFYAILTVLLVPLIALTKLDFGPMAKAENRVRQTGQLYWPESKPLRRAEEKQDYTTGSKTILIWLPLLVLFVTLFSLLISKGFPFTPVPGGDFRVALSTAYLFAAVTIVILMIIYKVKKFNEIFDIYTTGYAEDGVCCGDACPCMVAWTSDRGDGNGELYRGNHERERTGIYHSCDSIYRRRGYGHSFRYFLGNIRDYAADCNSDGHRTRCAYARMHRSSSVRWYFRRP